MKIVRVNQMSNEEESMNSTTTHSIYIPPKVSEKNFDH
jgi:hypothetical protein